MATERQARYAAPAAAAAADILLALARSQSPLSSADLAQRTERTKSLVYRVLTELEARQFVTRAGGGYSLGVAAVEVGGAFLTSVPLLTSIRTSLRGLAELSQETANLGTLQGDQVLYVAREEGPLSVVSVSRAGKLLPANATAIGKALLADLADDDVREVFASRLAVDGRLSQLTPRTVASIDDLLWDLERARSRGYAEEDGETVLGRSCLAVAFPFGEQGIPIAAIGVSMTEHRFREMRDEVLRALLDARDRIGRERQARVVID